MQESIMDRIRIRAKELNRKVCLTESDDIRNIQAARKIVDMGYAIPVLVGKLSTIEKLAKEHNVNLSGIEIVDIPTFPKMDEYVHFLMELRKDKGMDEKTARETLKDSCFFSATMVARKDAHGYVSGGGNPKGYNHNTGQKIKPALQLFKTAKGIKTASTFFMMQMPDPKWGFHGTLFYADCALVINPSMEQLAEIAVCTARSFKNFTGEPAKVGMISCSTKGSAKDPIIEKVVEATKLAQSMAPDLLIDGELQFDSAVIPWIAEKKAPNSKVAGYCNVLIFPDLNCGNSMYKATERLAGATAIGPITQGLRMPFNDVSRGCSVDDIVDVTAVTTICEWTD